MGGNSCWLLSGLWINTQCNIQPVGGFIPPPSPPPPVQGREVRGALGQQAVWEQEQPVGINSLGTGNERLTLGSGLWLRGREDTPEAPCKQGRAGQPVTLWSQGKLRHGGVK